MTTFLDERYDKTGKIRIMTSADGYCMCRRPGAIPFVMKIKEWEKLSKQPLPGGASS